MSARHGTSMSHREHLGCGRFPSSNMITMSRTCRLQKCIHIAVRVPDLPGEPSTGQLHGPPLVGKASRYACASPPVAEASQLQRSSFTCPCCVIQWDAIDPATISLPHSPHSTCPFCRSRYIGPSPAILRPYAASDCVPATWHGWKTMLTVFPTFFRRPTRLNKLTRESKSHCSQQGPDNATTPSSA